MHILTVSNLPAFVDDVDSEVDLEGLRRELVIMLVDELMSSVQSVRVAFPEDRLDPPESEAGGTSTVIAHLESIVVMEERQRHIQFVANKVCAIIGVALDDRVKVYCYASRVNPALQAILFPLAR